MFIWLMNWWQRIVIVGFIALLLLLGSSSNWPTTRLLWGGWWVQQQQLPKISSWRRVKRRVKLPGWYLRLQAWYLRWSAKCYHWASVPKGEYLLRLGCYLLAWSAVGWIWLLRWVIALIMREKSIPLLQGNWGWAGGLPNHSATNEVQLQVLVMAGCEPEEAIRGQVKQLAAQIWLEETEIELEFEEKQAEAGTVSSRLGKPGEEEMREGSNQSDLSKPAVSTAAESKSRPVEKLDQDSITESKLPAPLCTIMHHFSKLDDPRVERTKKHQLFDIVVITICAVIANADTWVEVADFGRDREKWFRTFLDLPNGIPSHDTFGRVFRHLDPQQWQASFLSWIQAVKQVTGGQIVPIDGKTLRRSQDKTGGKKAIHMVSVFIKIKQHH